MWYVRDLAFIWPAYVQKYGIDLAKIGWDMADIWPRYDKVLDIAKNVWFLQPADVAMVELNIQQMIM